MRNRLRSRRGSWIIGHGSVAGRWLGEGTGGRRRSGRRTWKRVCCADARRSARLCNGSTFQPRDDRTQGVIFVLRMGWQGFWIADHLQLVGLKHPRKRIKEQAGVRWRP